MKIEGAVEFSLEAELRFTQGYNSPDGKAFSPVSDDLSQEGVSPSVIAFTRDFFPAAYSAEIISQQVLNTRTYLVRLDLDDLPSEVHQVLICLDGSALLNLKVFRSIQMTTRLGADESILQNEAFSAEAFDGQSVLLASLCRTEMGWELGAPGIALPGQAKNWLCSRLMAKANTSLLRYLHADLPNAMNPRMDIEAMSPMRVAHHVRYGFNNRLEQMYKLGKLAAFGVDSLQEEHVAGNEDLRREIAEYATIMLVAAAEVWPDSGLDGNRKAFIRRMIAEGADWTKVFPIQKSREAEGAVGALLYRADNTPQWVKTVLGALPKDVVIEYAATSERADGAYKFLPLRYLIPHLSEERRVNALEVDLGL
jgi:hypothetical protein